MTMQATDGYQALTEKEKQTLRLIVRGHDAKSIARSLDLSVHTVNERLRDARRKMAVSSSREAARRLFDTEGSNWPNSFGDTKIGEAAVSHGMGQGVAPISGVRRSRRLAWITIGGTLMTLVLGFFALVALPQLTAAPPQSPPAATEAADPAIVEAARQFLVLGDQGRWDESYRATGTPFQKLNTLQVWRGIEKGSHAARRDDFARADRPGESARTATRL
jgi:DNA-binding CsgD family transcriptional regulator